MLHQRLWDNLKIIIFFYLMNIKKCLVQLHSLIILEDSEISMTVVISGLGKNYIFPEKSSMSACVSFCHHTITPLLVPIM